MAITSFRAGEAVSTGDALFVNVSGFAYKGIATSQTGASVIGLSLVSASPGDLVQVCNDSIFISSGSLLPGQLQYLSLTTSGVLIDYSTWEAQFSSLPGSGAFLTRVGRAISITNIELEIERPVYVTK